MYPDRMSRDNHRLLIAPLNSTRSCGRQVEAATTTSILGVILKLFCATYEYMRKHSCCYAMIWNTGYNFTKKKRVLASQHRHPRASILYH